MSNTYCRFCKLSFVGLYINCPRCGTNLMHPGEPKTPPEAFELAEGNLPETGSQTPTDLDQAIGMLRQWINEEHVLRKKMVTNEELHHWLDEAIQAKVDAAVEEALQAVYDFPKGRYTTDVFDVQMFVKDKIEQRKNKEK